MTTTLIVVRHGQSEGNVARRFMGQTETALTETGREQAKRTAEFLKDYPITRIYASDLSRAMDTAGPTAELHGLPIESTPRLREINAGDWEGLPFDELNTTFAESYTTWRCDIGRAHPENGESVAALFKRVNDFVKEILERHRGECVALFTHATPVRMMAAEWYGYSLEGAAQVQFCPNASVSIVEYEDDGSHRIVFYGYDAHQGDLASRLPRNIV